MTSAPPHGSLRHILAVCGPGPEHSDTLATALRLARTHQAKLTVLGVIELPSDHLALGRRAGISPAELTQRLANDLRDDLHAMVRLMAPDQSPQCTVRTGKPFLEVIHHVIEHQVDLVMKAADPFGGLHSHLFSSTDQHLLRKCPCPVWLRRNGTSSKTRAIVAAVDLDAPGQPGSGGQGGLNESIVDIALKIASGEDATVHVLHVWDAPGAGLLRLWSDEPDPTAAQARYEMAIKAEHMKALDRLIAGREQLIGELRKGVARHVIPARVRALGAELLVMGTIARTGIPGFIIGNTAEDIINSVECALLTVKPPGYESPVAPVRAASAS